MRSVFVVGAARTAVGRFGGSLKDVPAERLAAAVMREALARSMVNPGALDEVIMGSVLQTSEAPNVARVASFLAEIPVSVPAYTVHRQCGSGLQAIINGAMAIALGEADAVLAGGVESMSRAPYYSNDLRFGARAGHVTVYDPFVKNAESCAPAEMFGPWNMGLTAENLASKYGISRQEQDAFALASHQKALAAAGRGEFVGETCAVEVPQGKGKPPLAFAQEECPRADTSLEALARLRPAFKTDGTGTVTAGNSCPLSDGAAAVVLASEEVADRLAAKGTKPLARLVSYAVAGVDPRVMGIGPVDASRGALAKAGLGLDQMDRIELNEAFAAQALAVLKELGLTGDPRVNPAGGAIALGHPVGATGAKLLVTAAHALSRGAARRALVTLCIGGGMGIAAVLESSSA